MDARSLRPRLPGRSSMLAATAARGPFARTAAKAFVAGANVADAMRVVRQETEAGRRVSLVPILPAADSPDAILAAQAEAERAMKALADAGLRDADVTLDLLAFGVLAGDVTAGLLLSTFRDLGTSARNCGVTLTLTVSDPLCAEASHVVAAELRQDFPSVGSVLPTRLREAPGDIAENAKPGFRTRLTTERLDAELATTSARENGTAFIEATKTLLGSGASVGFETDDSLLLDIASSLVERHGADAEIVVPFGGDVGRHASFGGKPAVVRTLIPYGPEPAEYVRRLLVGRPGLALSLAPVRRRS